MSPDPPPPPPESFLFLNQLSICSAEKKYAKKTWKVCPPFFQNFSQRHCLRRKAYRYRRDSKLQKILYIKNIFENGRREGAYLSS